MKLNLKDRKELRRLLENEFRTVPNGIKISLDEALLEELLFEKFPYYSNGKKALLKLPVWSGREILSKIDLSGVDFSDVSWAILYSCAVDKTMTFLNGKDITDYFYKNGAHPFYYAIDYAHTNAVIDFSKSYEAKNNASGKAILNGCDFTGTSLANNSLSVFAKIKDSSLSGTNIQIENVDTLLNIGVECTNFDYLDLHGESIDLETLASKFSDCSFKETGIDILFDKDKFDEESSVVSTFLSMIRCDAIGGCYLNGHYFPTTREIVTKREELSSLYDSFKSEYFNNVTDTIRRQVKMYVKKED